MRWRERCSSPRTSTPISGNEGERRREALPHAGVVELPVGHWPQEEAPDEVVAAVRRFLAESAPRCSDSP